MVDGGDGRAQSTMAITNHSRHAIQMRPGAGFIANSLAEKNGFTSPFNGAVPALILCFLVVAVGWTENYGSISSSSNSRSSSGSGVTANSSSSSSSSTNATDGDALLNLNTPERKRLGVGQPDSAGVGSAGKGPSPRARRLLGSPASGNGAGNEGDESPSFKVVLLDILNDTRMLMVGLISALFEASLYIFVFVWTPSLQEKVPGYATQWICPLLSWYSFLS